MSNSPEEQYKELVNRWKDQPLTYLKEQLNIEEIWTLQRDLIQAVLTAQQTHQQIYVASGNGLGKDFIASAIANWFLETQIPSKVILTAPGHRQVDTIMWRETLSKFQNRNIKVFGRAYSNPYIEIRKEDWFLIGFATKETGASAEAQGAKFKGYHAPNLLIIVSEGQGVEDNIFDQIDAVATAENNVVIFLGNPTRASGRFAKGLRDKVNNIVFNFSVLDNPNYKHRREIIPGLSSYQWVEDKRRKWGETDPRWISYVLGQIAENELNNTFPQSWINHVRGRWGLLDIHDPTAGVAVDSAGMGVDDNIIMSGRGGEPQDVFAKTMQTPTQNVLKAVEMCKALNGHFIVFDCDGLGIRDYQEAIALPRDYVRGIQMIKFHGSGPSTLFETLSDGKQRPVYANLRAEASFITKDRGLAGKCSINEKDKELLDDLIEEQYFENQKGLIQIEDKDDLRERLGRSPGRGDAYKMLQWAFAQGIQNKVYADTSANKLQTHYSMDDNIGYPANKQQSNLQNNYRTDED